MALISILLFFAFVFLIALGLISFVKESEAFLERNLMRIGISIGAFITFGLLLNLLNIPLDWRFFLAISILSALLYFLKNKEALQNFMKNPKFKLTKTDLYVFAMLILFFFTFFMYHKGAFIYPYLEDDDSWSHALGVKYVSIEKTAFSEERIFHYIDPYPPSYDILFGVLHQTNDSVYWTLKFFNALIVSLSIIFFYFFAKVFTHSQKKALFATFALFAVPAFLSHFIWAIALTVPLFFVSFYAVEKINEDKNWWIIAAIIIAATLTSSPTHSTYFGLFFLIYFAARFLVERKFLMYEFLAGFSGLMLSFILWWLPIILKYGFFGTLINLGILHPGGVIATAGTGDRVYTLADFIFAKNVNMINNPIGIGIVLSILTIVGLVLLILKYKDMLRKENYYKLVLLLWFIFTFYSVNAAGLPIKLSPFRTWMLLAIPISFLSGEAINLINDFVKSFVKNFVKSSKIIIVASFVVLGLITYGVITTSFVQKYAVNTALWPPGAFWISNEEIQGYVWIKDNLPKNSKVFTFVNNGPIIGMDMYTCHWCKDIRDYQRTGFNQTIEHNYNWLKKELYKYIVIDGQTVRKFGINETKTKIQEFIDFNKFKPVFNNNGLIIFEIF